MQVRRKTDEHGNSSTDNFVLDNVIETIEKYSNDKDEMIKQLTIKTFEYGKLCITQIAGDPNISRETVKERYEDLSDAIDRKIAIVKTIESETKPKNQDEK